MTQSSLFSVVICTYNRAELLREAIQSICEQDLDSSQFELLVIDNNSSDNTRDVVESFSTPFPIRYIFEPKQGLSHARNRGYIEARGEYVAYLDDDATAPPHWLSVAHEIIEEHRPSVFGGPVDPDYRFDKPAWFKDIYLLNDSHLRGDPGRIDGHLFGGNMFWRREVLVELGGFDARLGMKGKTIGWDEESHAQRKLRTTYPHAVIYGDCRLNIYHRVDPKKTTWRWITRHFFSTGRQKYHANALYAKLVGQQFIHSKMWYALESLKTSLLLVISLLNALLRCGRTIYPFPQQYVYEVSMMHIHRLGKLYEGFFNKSNT